MKKLIFLPLLALGLSATAGETVNLTLKIDNPLDISRKDYPVVLDLASHTHLDIKSATVSCDGKQLAWQLDDINGDDKADQLAFVADIPAKGTSTLSISLSEDVTTNDFKPATRAYIKLRDEKEKHPEIVSITFPGDANLLDMYNSIYGHGAVMETAPVALRIYMDNRQSVDIYSKTTPQLELDVTGFYTTRDQLAQGYGCDILWAGKSVGAGSFRGYQNATPCYIDTVSTRTQTVITSGPVRSIVEVVDKGWIYNGHPVDMVQRYTMWAGHRDVEVSVNLKGYKAGDVFCTGVQKLENDNVGFVNPDGLAGSWGNNVPDKGAPDLVEGVGLGLIADKANLSSVREDEFNYLTMLHPDKDGNINYHIAFCGAREKGGFSSSEKWFEFLKTWKQETDAPCTISVTAKEILASAPFELAPVREPIFPARDFVITDFGAKPGDSKTDTVTIFMIGDSTMANKPLDKENQERGWGQLLPTHLQGAVKVDNHAVNGRSSLSFINEGRWDKVLSKIKAGDYLIIQFGHNDEKKNRPDRYTEPGGSFDANLRRFVTEARAKGATPVLMNSIVRRNFPADAEGYEKDGYDYMKYDNEGPILVDTHGAYLDSPRNVAAETGAKFIDLNAITHQLVQEAGTLASRDFFMWIPAGKYEFCPEGKTDNTHLNIHGATVVSRLAAIALAQAIPDLAPYIKAE